MNVPTNRPAVPQSVIDNLDDQEMAKLHLVVDTLGATAVGEFEPDYARNQEPSILEAADAVLQDEPGSSWRAVDLREHLRPDDGRGAPSLLLRADGAGCLYEGKRNALFGPYESGKT